MTDRFRAATRIAAPLVALITTFAACSPAAPAAGTGTPAGQPTTAPTATAAATTTGATSPDATGGAGGSITVGLTTSIAGLGDQGFNDLAAAGVKRAEDTLGVDGQVVESETETDYVPNLQGFADEDADLVYAVGFLMQDALKEVAGKYPQTKFAIIDAVVDQPNVASVTFKEEQGSFLAGVFAGMMTMKAADGSVPKMKGTKKVGFIGGGDIPLIHKFQEGFEQGVKAVDPSIQVLVAYAGSFTDPAKGKELARSQYNSGADIVYQAAGPTGTGVIEAAKELDRFVIGVDDDQNRLAPDHVITSMLKKVDVAVFDTIQSVVDGTFKGGQRVFGVENGGVGLAPFHGLDPVVPADVKSKIAEFEGKLKSGELVIKLSPAAGG